MRPVPEDLAHTIRFDPTADDTAAAIGNVGVEVVSTVTMIVWVETACGQLLHPHFEEGEASVGTRVAVDHVGAAYVGRPVTVRAEVTGTERRKISFGVRLEQDGREVMRGEHIRAVIDLERFLDRQAEQRERSVVPSVTFFFDVHSPWSYLASTRIDAMARRHNAPVIWRPIHLPKLMKRIDGMRPMDQTPARVAWYEQDVHDRMAEHGLAYDPHPDYPLRPSRALRACVYAAEQGCASAFVQAVMRGYWSEHADITDLDWLQAVADATGLGPRAIAEIVEAPVYKQAVADNTDEAIAAGVFGVPSFLFGDKLYFGADHMDMLEAAMARAATG
ncbi:MAG: DsbA family protein [Rhodospirillales bacterium]|nr:DsbA family protein [Rhodospirillales bacterium]